MQLRDGEWSLFGHTYRLRDEVPISFAWSDGTVQTVQEWDGHTITWTTTNAAYPHIYWDAVVAPTSGSRAKPPPPPQGWLCTEVGSADAASARVVAPVHGALRCFACGDDMISPFRSATTFRSLAANVAPSSLEPGDAVVVAATLERAVVVAASVSTAGLFGEGFESDRVNDEGAPVALGNNRLRGYDGSHQFYCGRRLGRAAGGM